MTPQGNAIIWILITIFFLIYAIIGLWLIRFFWKKFKEWEWNHKFNIAELHLEKTLKMLEEHKMESKDKIVVDGITYVKEDNAIVVQENSTTKIGIRILPKGHEDNPTKRNVINLYELGESIIVGSSADKVREALDKLALMDAEVKM